MERFKPLCLERIEIEIESLAKVNQNLKEELKYSEKRNAQLTTYTDTLHKRIESLSQKTNNQEKLKQENDGLSKINQNLEEELKNSKKCNAKHIEILNKRVKELNDQVNNLKIKEQNRAASEAENESKENLRNELNQDQMIKQQKVKADQAKKDQERSRTASECETQLATEIKIAEEMFNFEKNNSKKNFNLSTISISVALRTLVNWHPKSTCSTPSNSNKKVLQIILISLIQASPSGLTIEEISKIIEKTLDCEKFKPPYQEITGFLEYLVDSCLIINSGQPTKYCFAGILNYDRFKPIDLSDLLAW